MVGLLEWADAIQNNKSWIQKSFWILPKIESNVDSHNLNMLRKFQKNPQIGHGVTPQNMNLEYPIQIPEIYMDHLNNRINCLLS